MSYQKVAILLLQNHAAPNVRDGQGWLLEHDRDGSNLMRLDGSHRRSIEDAGWYSEVYWLDDNLHWLEIMENGGVRRKSDYDDLWLYSRVPGKEERDLPKALHFLNDVVGTSYAMDGVLLCFPEGVAQGSEEPQENDLPATRIVIRRRLLTSTHEPVQVSGERGDRRYGGC